MELVQVRITSTVVTQQYGTLMPGTILRTSAAYAKHLVEDASAAKYITAPATTEAAPAPAKAVRSKKTEQQ